MNLAFGDGIEATFMPGMALTQPLYRKSATMNDTVALNRFHGVIGTARIKPAILA